MTAQAYLETDFDMGEATTEAFDQWMQKYGDSPRQLFLCAHDLTFINHYGNLEHPLKGAMFNDDANPRILAAKKHYFSSHWFRKQSLEFRREAYRKFGVPPILATLLKNSYGLEVE